MDTGDPGARASADQPEREGTPEELSGLRERIARLEAHVAGLQRALELAGWTRAVDYSVPRESIAAPVSQAPTPPPMATPLPAKPPPTPQAWPIPLSERSRPWVAPAFASPAVPDGLQLGDPWDGQSQAQAQPPIANESDFDPIGFLIRLGPARILALVGGGALLLGMAYFLSLAFSRGWITPEMRVLLGLVIGFGLLPAGGLLFDRDRPTLGHVVVAVGLGTIDLALFASRLYQLAPSEVALFGALIAAIAAGFIAVRWNSQLVAGMGIAAVLAAPPIVSAPANLVTVGFLGAVMVGVAYVAFRRDWEWLPWLSFALTAPQLLSWLAPGGVEPVVVIVVLGAYWILFAVSAVLPVILGQPRPLPTPVALLCAVATFTTLAAYVGLSAPELRGSFIGALALANLAAGYGLVRRRGRNDDLALTALGLGVALYVIAWALAVQGPAMPIAWTLAMVGAAWVWARFDMPRAGIVAAAIGALVAANLLLVQYSPSRFLFSLDLRTEQLVPYADPEGAALAVFLAGLAVTAWLSRTEIIRQAIAAGALLLVAITLPLEARDLAPQYEAPMVLFGWTVLALLGLGGDRLWHRAWRFEPLQQPLPPAGLVIGAFAAFYLGTRYGLFSFFAPGNAGGTPFANEQSLATLVVVIGLWLVALTRDEIHERAGTICVSLLVIGALFRQQLPLEWAVVGWSGLAIGALVGSPSERRAANFAHGTAATLLGAGALATLLGVAPGTRLMFQAWSPEIGGGPPNAATIALGALAIGLAVATWREERLLGTRWLGSTVLATVVYGLSVGLVDVFVVRAPGPETWEEVGKQAQVALTILWALLGLGLLGYGLVRDSLAGRGAGLALLGLATVKAFIFDLSALDIAYRVLSLIGVGLLLLAGAYAYQRLRARTTTEP